MNLAEKRDRYLDLWHEAMERAHCLAQCHEAGYLRLADRIADRFRRETGLDLGAIRY